MVRRGVPAGKGGYTDAKPMRNRVLIASLLVVVPGLMLGQASENAPAKTSPKMTQKLSPEAVHRSALVIDTHADTPQRFVDENFDMAQPLNGGNLNIESAKK